MTIEQIKLLPSYDALKRNGLTDENVVQFYTLPKGQRGAFLNSFKIVQPKVRVSKAMDTNVCSLFEEVDAKLREYMGSDFVVNGKTYNMIELGYRYKWNNNKSRFGVHKVSWRRNFLGDKEYTKKSIELSKYLLDHTDKTLESWINTILHEIAHAIDFAIRGTSNHDSHWVRIAKSIGCDGERCGNYKVNATKKWEANCECGVVYKRHKLTQSVKNGSCGRCRKPLNWKQNF